MLKALVVIVPVVLAIFSLVQVAQSRSDLVRTLPRWAWALVILLVPVLGPVAWLFVGRPRESGRSAPPPKRRPVAPDDDPDFLRGIRFKKPNDPTSDRPDD